ncbi:MAG: chalcone isomerase family protein [Aquabacterium sp.]|uniref:chalcone isomerase family protein n=1 Tax=Aquabacterium sp. TaxID=1872578 RepID=UPI002726D123|nr:chalcone isomerase family protein [Aquabacterium sp.]MDO9003226.1 chalcone isomerase family protein [Aquabacterium sp.]
MQDDRIALPPFENHRRQLMASAMAAALVPWAKPAQAATVELEGVQLEDTITAYGQKLVLNGAAVRKRGYFKADVTALYLPEKRTTPDAIFKLNGIRRIQLNILREFTSSTISRIFIADFKQNSTDAEFKQLINEISQVGAAYSAVKRVSKGDVVNLDWLPGKGWMCSINGKQLVIDPGVTGGTSNHAINNELAYQIYMRMYIGPAAPEELRNGLLGLTRLPRAVGGSKDKDGDD